MPFLGEDPTIVVGSEVASPLSAADMAQVPVVLAEAQAVSAEVTHLEELLATTDATPAEQQALRDKLATLTSLAEQVAFLAQDVASRDREIARLRSEADRKQAILDSMRSGVSGLGGKKPYPVTVPYVDVTDPALPKWNVKGAPHRAAQIASGARNVNFLPAQGEWVFASRDNGDGDVYQGDARPALSQQFACPSSGNWSTGKQNFYPEIKARLLAAGQISECQTSFASPIEVLSTEGVRDFARNPAGATTCLTDQRLEPTPWFGSFVRMAPSGNKTGFVLQQLGVKYIEPTADADYNTRAWLDAGMPGDMWVCLHDRDTGFSHLLSEVSSGFKQVLKNPYVSAVLLSVLAPNPLVYAMIARAFLTGREDDMSRTFTRALAAGAIVPGYGPIAAVIAPRQTQRFLATATEEMFFTVPGFSSLVVYAETNKRRRDALKVELTRKQAAFYEKYKIGLVVRVVSAAISLVVAIVTLGTTAPALAAALALLNVALSVWEAAYQAEVAINSLQIIERQLIAQGAADLAAFDQAYRDLVALNAGLDAEIARLCGSYTGTSSEVLKMCGRPVSEKQASPSGLPVDMNSETLALIGLAVAVGVSLFSRRK